MAELGPRNSSLSDVLSSEGSPSFWSEPARLLLSIVVLFSLFRYLHDLVKVLLESPFIDFAHYYTYATVIAEGHSPLDTDAVKLVEARQNLRSAGVSALYSPLFYFVMGTWVHFPFRQAAAIWLFINQTCLVGACLLCFSRFASAPRVGFAAVLFVVLNYQPLFEDLVLGQSNILLLFFVSLAWWGLRTERHWVAAGAVVVAMFIKPQYGLLLPLLWWMGYRRVFLEAVLLSGLGLGMGILLLGFPLHSDWLQSLRSVPDFYNSWSLNLSPRATLFRLLGESSLGQRVLVEVSSLSLNVCILIFVAKAIPRHLPTGTEALDLAWALGLVAILLLSPLVEEHHLVVLLLPLTILLLGAPDRLIPQKEWVILLVSVLLLGSRYSLEQFPAFHHGALSLLATGKLLGVVGVAWVLWDRLRAQSQTPAMSR
jgi:hypothetical protein